MSDKLNQFILGHAIVDGTGEMTTLLFGAIERHQCGTRDETAVALGETRPFPDVAKQDVFGEVYKFRRKRPQPVARVGGRGFGHAFLLFTAGWQR